MKKLLLATILTGLVSVTVSAQWVTSGTNIYNSNTGNIGISNGSTFTPLTKFHVNGFGSFGDNVTSSNAIRALNLVDSDAVMRVLRISATAAPAVELISRRSANGADSAYWDFYAHQTDASFRIRDRINNGLLDRLTISNTGNVGIGTTTPNSNAKLDVNGNIYCNNKIFIGTPDANTTTNIASYELAVNGDAIFTRAVVKLYSNWPDYVFNEKYQLPVLPELEKFIKDNKHLPDVPSAMDVEKKGLDLGSNQAILLQKIEELTLYLIEQNKRIEQLEKKLAE